MSSECLVWPHDSQGAIAHKYVGRQIISWSWPIARRQSQEGHMECTGGLNYYKAIQYNNTYFYTCWRSLLYSIGTVIITLNITNSKYHLSESTHSHFCGRTWKHATPILPEQNVTFCGRVTPIAAATGVWLFSFPLLNTYRTYRLLSG